jgi:hypothetical protein
MLTNENKFAFKIHRTLLDVGSEVIQLAIEHKIKENGPIPDFFREHHNNMNSPFLKDVKITLENYVRNNSNQYPNNLDIFDISSKIAIARNLLNSTNNHRNEIEMGNLNFDKCLNNLRVIRNKFYGHLTNYQINETEYNEIKSQLKIPNTVFTKVTSNYNLRTACHKDSGDYSGGLGNLVVVGENFEGGYLGFPQFKVLIKICPGDFLLMDVHQAFFASFTANIWIDNLVSELVNKNVARIDGLKIHNI